LRATCSVFANARSRGLEVDPRLVTADGATSVTGCNGTGCSGLERWSPESARVLAVSGGWIERDIEGGVLPRQLAEAKPIDGRPATTHRPRIGRRWNGSASGPRSSTPASSMTATW
jgi:hypothetical protein